MWKVTGSAQCARCQSLSGEHVDRPPIPAHAYCNCNATQFCDAEFSMEIGDVSANPNGGIDVSYSFYAECCGNTIELGSESLQFGPGHDAMNNAADLADFMWEWGFDEFGIDYNCECENDDDFACV